jgi:hypothetical protein
MRVEIMVSALSKCLQPNLLVALNTVNSPFEAGLHGLARRVVCLESEAARAEKLQARLHQEAVEAHQLFLTDCGGLADYVYASHPMANGFLPVSSFHSIWPSLYEERRETVETVTFAQAMTILGLGELSSGSWLLLGDASAAHAFTANIGASSQFDFIVHRAGVDLSLGAGWQCVDVADVHPLMGWRIQNRRVDRELEVERVRVSELEQEGARVRGELEVERVRVSELEQEGAKDQRDRDEALRKLNDLEVTNQELKARQALFEKEFDKAEGQLELIKELITLRDLAGSTQQSEAK